jgi:uncharacterized RDD family membrane protein YckC
VTSSEPSPALEDQDSGPIGPGPGVRWSGDGSLAPRRAPRWGSGGTPAAEADLAAVPPPGVRPRERTVDGMVLVSVSRRLAAFFVDLLVKIVIFAIALAFSGIEVIDATNVPVGIVLGAAVLNFAYSFLFGIGGISPAQRLLRMRVVAMDGSAPGMGRSLVRALFSLNETVLYVSSVWIIFDRRRQALHDKAAGTLVVARSAVEDDAAK